MPNNCSLPKSLFSACEHEQINALPARSSSPPNPAPNASEPRYDVAMLHRFAVPQTPVSRPALFPTNRALLLVGVLITSCGGTDHAAIPSGQGGHSGTLNTEPTPVMVSGTVTSNLLGVPFTVTKTASTMDLDLISSNLVPDPTSAINFVEWFGEVRNNGATPVCFVEVTVNFKTADGSGVQAIHSYADGDPYKIASLEGTIPCIPPGKSAPLYDNDLPAAAVDVSLIGVAEASLSAPNAHPEAVPHPANPRLAGVTLGRDRKNGDGYWVVTGTLTATETIYNIGLYAYYKDDNGLVLQQAFAGHSDTLNAGASWDFQTFHHQGARPGSYLLTYDFLQGVKPTSAALVLSPPEGDSQADGALAAVRQAWQLTQDRARIARQR